MTSADASAPADDGSVDRLSQLLQFPVDFPVKIMGVQADGFVDAQADFDPRQALNR
jgi:putative lipoic acid-binding regulatory protein